MMMRKKNFLQYAIICLIILLATFATSVRADSSYRRPPRLHAPIEIDAVREEYLSLEQSLWQHLDRSTNNRNAEQQLRKIIDSHRRFVHQHMQSTWEEDKYQILNHYEWSLLERDLMQIEHLFGVFHNYLRAQHNNVEDIDEKSLMDVTENALRNDRTFSMARIFQDIELIMVKQTMYYRAMMVSLKVVVKKLSPSKLILVDRYIIRGILFKER